MQVISTNPVLLFDISIEGPTPWRTSSWYMGREGETWETARGIGPRPRSERTNDPTKERTNERAINFPTKPPSNFETGEHERALLGSSPEGPLKINDCPYIFGLWKYGGCRGSRIREMYLAGRSSIVMHERKWRVTRVVCFCYRSYPPL